MTDRKAERGFAVTKRDLAALIGASYGSMHEPSGRPSDAVAIACNQLDSAADELNVIRHALASEELDGEAVNIVLYRLAERMSAAATIAWSAYLADSRNVSQSPANDGSESGG